MTRRAKILLAALVLAAFAAGPVAAATYYVRPGGSNFKAGTSYAAAWSTIAKANSTVAAGDVVYVYPGAYADFPNPAAAGADETHRFTYIGAHQSLDPTADSLARSVVILPSGTLSKPFVTLRGLRIVGSLTMGSTARKDTVAYIQVSGALALGDADYCIFDRCTFNGPTFSAATGSGEHAIGNEFYNCNFWRLGSNHGGAASVISFGAITGSTLDASVDSSTISFNRFDITLTSGGNVASHAWLAYGMRDCNLRGNLIAVHNQHNTGRWGALVLADSTSRNNFDRDTLNAEGPSKALLSSVAVLTPKTVGRNTFDSCWVKVEDCPAQFSAGLNHDILTYSTFIGGGTGLFIRGALGRSFIDHCTVAGGGVGAGIFDIANATPGWVDNTIVTNSIFYSFDPGTSNDCVASSNSRGAMFVPVASVDSSYYAGGAHAAHLRTEGNLYSYYGHSTRCVVGADTVGQRSIVFSTPWGDGGNAPRPFVLASSIRAPWDSLWCAGCDDSSRYGSPMFRDSTRLNFDPRPGLYSRATAGDLSGGDIGAVAFTAQASINTGSPAYFNDIGATQVKQLAIRNAGTAVLSITHLTPSHSSVTAGQDTVSVGGYATKLVTITFTPTGDGSAPATVRVQITSNDPLKPTTTWSCYINQTGGSGAEYQQGVQP